MYCSVLIEWMSNYSILNKTDLVGCDMKLIGTLISELIYFGYFGTKTQRRTYTSYSYYSYYYVCMSMLHV